MKRKQDLIFLNRDMSIAQKFFDIRRLSVSKAIVRVHCTGSFHILSDLEEPLYTHKLNWDDHVPSKLIVKRWAREFKY